MVSPIFKKLSQLPIRWKITGLVFGITLFSLIISGIIFLGYMLDVKKEELGQRSMTTGQLVAQMKTVQDQVVKKDGSDVLQPLVERIRAVNKNDYIVILNMDQTRLTHPISERLYTKFSGGDEGPAFSEHIYLSYAKAEQGTTVRAFVPIINDKREQVGVVVVGNLMPTFTTILKEIGKVAIIMFLIPPIFGIWGAWLLASHIKKQTFEMEPDELARVLVERTATFNAMQEGVVAIDGDGIVTVMNEVAKNMLNVSGDVIGKKLDEIVPDTRLPEVLEIEKPLYQREFYIQGRPVLSNRIPITVGDKTVGALAIFQDKSEANRLAQELTGVQMFVDALRVKNHEYSNKIHTIAGLIQLNQAEKALDYIFQLTNEQKETDEILVNQIHDESILGLITGKVSRGKELGITVRLDPECYFMNYPEGITIHDIVVILGNLIDNAFDSIIEKNSDIKEVDVLFQETEDYLLIEVKDTGVGVPEGREKRLFSRGFSTKNTNVENRGIGLFLIRSIVYRVEGKVQIVNCPEGGAVATIKLPMKRGL